MNTDCLLQDRFDQFSFYLPVNVYVWAIFKTGNMKSGNGNGERGTGNEERGTRNGERGIFKMGNL